MFTKKVAFQAIKKVFLTASFVQNLNFDKKYNVETVLVLGQIKCLKKFLKPTENS